MATTLLLMGKKGRVLMSGDAVLLAVTGGASAVAVSLWSYAINLRSETITASSVNASNVISSGVKARAIQLKCSFRYNN